MALTTSNVSEIYLILQNSESELIAPTMPVRLILSTPVAKGLWGVDCRPGKTLPLFWPTCFCLGMLLWLCLAKSIAAQQPPTVEHYILVPGQHQPLEKLAQLYQADPERAARMNIMTPDWFLTPEQTVLLPVPIETAISMGLVPMIQVFAFPGQTLDMVAQERGVPGPWLSVINGIKLGARLFPGQPILVPDFVQPHKEYRIGQVTVEFLSPILAQGSTGFLTLTVTTENLPDISWQGKKLPLSPVPETMDVAELPSRYFTHIPVHPLQESGTWPLVFAYTSQKGKRISASLPIQIYDPGRFYNRTINIPDPVAAKLTVENVTAEAEALQQQWDRYSEHRWSDEEWQHPLAAPYPTSAPFGERRTYRWHSPEPYPYNFHSGHDFAVPLGTQVRAPAAGLVVLATDLLTKGKAVILDHGRGVLTGYWHLHDIQVTEGAEVTAGQVLGLVGDTGISLGPHLHWELQIHGIPVNPLQFLAAYLIPPKILE